MNNNFPFGKIQQISEVGLVQKIGKPYVKYLVDRLIGFLPYTTSDPTLLLCGMKARVAPATAQQEHEQVLQYHNNEKYISTHSDLPSSWNYISKPSERLQMLLHRYTYESTYLFHVAGDSQFVSGILIDINPTLLEN